VSRNLNTLKDEPANAVQQKFKNLVEHEEFSEISLKEGLSKKPRVNARLTAAETIFSGN
jgi:predicted DNA binding CopG/RHH family protein